MGVERVVKVNPVWLDTKQSEESLMKRLCQIISGDSNGPTKQNSGYAWKLDGSNDWWAEIKEGKLIIAYRYGEDRLNALVAFCEEFLS